jgi:hypothetical protein
MEVTMGKKLKPGQIGELVELDRACGGIGGEVAALIKRLTDGRRLLDTNDVRVIQAKVLFDKGLGGDFSFEAYLATIPEIPTSLLADDPNLPLLRLVDPRLGLVKTCELFGIKFKEFGYSNEDAVPFDTRHEIPNTPFWVRAHDGRKNQNRKPNDCRDECTDNLFAMTAMVAIMVWVQDPSIIKQGEHVLECPGSVYRAVRGLCAYLIVWSGGVRLCMDRLAVFDNPSYGSGGFRRE